MLTSRDVLVIDEAGMVGTRQMERVLSHAAEAGAKVVLVGDPQQLQAIEAGAAFRSIHERHGGIEISAVRRQREDWQRDATRDLATGRTDLALHAYRSHDMVHAADTREAARENLIERWDRDRQASPAASRIILTHTNAEVRELNEAAREKMREAGNLGEDVRITVDRGARNFASGDRVMFLQNERGLGVKNGTLGTIEQATTQSMTVRTDDGRSVAFDLKDYDKLDHGYAATVHKAQGMTVDRTHVLATPGMDAHGSYVALSRHRDHVDLHYGKDDFKDDKALAEKLSRDRSKDMATDYEPARGYAERRGITFRERVVEIVRKIVPEQVRDRIGGMFDGLRLPAAPIERASPGADEAKGPEREHAGVASGMESAPRDIVPERSAGPERAVAADPEAVMRQRRTDALIRHARAADAIIEAKRQGLMPSNEARRELGAARDAFDEVRPHGWQDAEAAYSKDNSLAHEAAGGKIVRTIQALQLETEIRTGRDAGLGVGDGSSPNSPNSRADRFVERWQKLDRTSQRQYEAGDIMAHKATRRTMGDMAKSLERDPQMESILRNRQRELGIAFETGRKLGDEIAFHAGIDIGRGRGIGI